MSQVHLNGPSVPRYAILKVNLNELSKKEKKILGLTNLRLPRVTIRGKINPSTRVSEVAQKKISYMSRNGPPENYCGALEVNLKTCAKGTKWRIYNMAFSFHAHHLLS